MLKIVRFSTTLIEPSVPFPIEIPLDGQDLALRVYCRYLPDQTPPPPELVVVCAIQDPPVAVAADGSTKETIRAFMLWPQHMILPPNFVKYIGAVPFGADKVNYDLIEVGA
jgi:hypothetical protein